MAPDSNTSANKIQTYLFSEKELAGNYGKDITGVTPPETFEQRKITQNQSGTWDDITIVTKDPYPSVNSVTQRKLDERNQVIQDYEVVIRPLDNEVYQYNEIINDKKQQIIDLVTTAVSAGCSNRVPTSGIVTSPSYPGAEDIGGAVCGYGSTIYEDRAVVKIYSNLNSFGAENPFDPISQSNLSESTYGKGFENFTEDNTGTALNGYKYIPTELASHVGSLLSPLTAEEQATCVGYANSIIAIAAELDELRQSRDSKLEKINTLKNDKNGEEVRRWGSNQSQGVIEQRKQSLNTQINHVQSFGDSIILDSLLFAFDAAKAYSVAHTIDSSTGQDEVTSITNTSSDGIVVTPTNKPLYDGGDGPSIHFNKFGGEQYVSLGKNYIGDGISTGDSSYAIEVWFKIVDDSNLTSTVTTGGATLVGVSSDFGYGMQLYKPSGVKLNFGTRGNGSLDTNTEFDPNVWYHVVCTRESGVGNKIYVNGTIDIVSDSTTLNITSSAEDVQIAKTENNILQSFKGKIGLVRIYGKNLSENDVTVNYNADKSRFT